MGKHRSRISTIGNMKEQNALKFPMVTFITEQQNAKISAHREPKTTFVVSVTHFIEFCQTIDFSESLMVE